MTFRTSKAYVDQGLCGAVTCVNPEWEPDGWHICGLPSGHDGACRCDIDGTSFHKSVDESLDLEAMEDSIRRGEAYPGEYLQAVVAELRRARAVIRAVRDMAQAVIDDEDAAGTSVSVHRAAVNAYELLRLLNGPAYTRCGSCGGLGVMFPLGPTSGENPPCESCGGRGRHFA